MSSITNYLNKIKTAVYGKDVRGAIHDAIKQVYDDASVEHDNANMEVKLARGTHNTLNDRLDNVDEIQAQTNAQLLQTNNKVTNIENDLSVGLSSFQKQSGDLDDTERIQRAINYCQDNDKTLSIPRGMYIIRQLNIKGGIKIYGNGSYFKKPKLDESPYDMTVDDMKWVRMFNIQHDSDEDSDMTVINDINFDGNCWTMWKEEDGYAQQQASIIYLHGGTKKGRLIVNIDGCTFKDNVSDGIHIRSNVVANISNCKSSDCFRGGLTITGGNSDINVTNFNFESIKLNDGIDMEIDGPGYGGSYVCNLNLTNIIIDKDLDISAKADSVVNLNNVKMKKPTWTLGCLGELNVSNSYLIADNTRLMISGNGVVKFTNTTFESDSEDIACKILFYQDPKGKVSFDNCHFKNSLWGIGGGRSFYADVEVKNCTFDKDCINAIGAKDGTVAFAPRNLIVSNNIFDNPGRAVRCLTITSPCTTVSLSGNDIINSENTGMEFHNPTVLFKNEIYQYGTQIDHSTGAKPTYFGSRTLIVDVEPGTAKIRGVSKNDIAFMRDNSQSWKFNGSSWESF